MSAGLVITKENLTRRWVCGVNRSGYYNGPGCTPDDPHDPWWRCGYRHEIHLSYTDELFEKFFNTPVDNPTPNPVSSAPETKTEVQTL